jgi:predicted ABC-class ATPase
MDGNGYGAYKALKGAWRFPDLVLHVDWVQGDPYAAPSPMRVELEPEVAALPASAVRTPSRAVGTAAWLARRFASAAREASGRRGSGRSGLIRMDAPGQEVLPQTAVLVGQDGSVEARFAVGLPARGRRVKGRVAAEILADELPVLVRESLTAPALDPEELERHAATNEDADHLRSLLRERGLVAFVADGALLPRRSGVDDRPLEGEVVPFRSPDPLRVEVELPNRGRVAGMGIPEGVTLVVGGGFHGKSTLLRAVEAGVWNHRPGDGRERVVSVSDAVKVRAEDGRAVAGVDISPFIDGLPLGVDTRAFTTPNASGSTSQAAGIVEALEAGAGTLLVDEDTSATNFMIRDRRMQELVPSEAEPITPFIDRVRSLHRELGVSAILVLGGSGDYLDVADTVLAMRDYRPEDVTERARAVAAAHPTGRRAEAASPPRPPRPRVPDPGTVDPRRKKRPVYVRVPDTRTLRYGEEEVDLAAVEQLVSFPQIRAVGQALAWAVVEGILDGSRTVPEILDAVEEAVDAGGLDALDARRPGDLAAFRRFELAATLNRLRSLHVR